MRPDPVRHGKSSPVSRCSSGPPPGGGSGCRPVTEEALKKTETPIIGPAPARNTEEAGTLRLRKRPIANLTEDRMEEVAGGHPHTCEPTCPPTCCPTCGNTCDGPTCPETCNTCNYTCPNDCYPTRIDDSCGDCYLLSTAAERPPPPSEGRKPFPAGGGTDCLVPAGESGAVGLPPAGPREPTRARSGWRGGTTSCRARSSRSSPRRCRNRAAPVAGLSGSWSGNRAANPDSPWSPGVGQRWQSAPEQTVGTASFCGSLGSARSRSPAAARSPPRTGRTLGRRRFGPLRPAAPRIEGPTRPAATGRPRNAPARRMQGHRNLAWAHARAGLREDRKVEFRVMVVARKGSRVPCPFRETRS